MASKHAVMVLEQSKVSPPPGSVAESSFHLTFFDIIWIHCHPVERIFFYQCSFSNSEFIDSIFPKLKSSLSLTLQLFCPLAGRLRRSPYSDDQFEVHYKDGDAVSFTAAESEANFQDISSDKARVFSDVYSLVPELKDSDDSKPLLALQVTLFPNSGISIGVSFHHAACDGAGFMQFMKSWASAYRSGGDIMPSVHPPPLFAKSVIADPNGYYSAFYSEIMPSPTDQAPAAAGPATCDDDDVVCATFSLGEEEIKRIKRWVLTKAGEAKESFHCSTFSIVCAYAWVLLLRARRHPNDQRGIFLFAVDCRSRLQPPVPETYFGNCIGPCFVEEDLDRLVGEDGVFFAAKAIGRATQGLRDGVLEGAERWMEKFGALSTTGRLLTTAGSPRLGVYGVEFGWGKPRKVEVMSIQKTGAMALAESSREEQGGVEIGLVLPKVVMDQFSSLFFMDI